MSQSSSSQLASSTTDGQADIAGNVDATKALSKDSNWRELLQVASDTSRSTRGSNYVQLATVDPATKTPRCRTCVFRGFQTLPKDHVWYKESYYLNHQSKNDSNDDNDTDDTKPNEQPLPCLMRMTTDVRSEKIRQSSALAEMVWWFPHSNEQFRIRGNLLFVGVATLLKEAVGDDSRISTDEYLHAERVKQWKAQTSQSQASFLRHVQPGSVKSDNDPKPAVATDNNSDNEPPDTFLLMFLQPQHVDYLRLTDLYRQVDERQEDGTWTKTRVHY